MWPSELHDRDYYAWIQHQVQALRERRIEDVDWVNAVEEIEDLGKSERRGIRNPLSRLLEHLLQLQYARGTARANNRRGWTLSIKGARIAIEDLLNESPSLSSQMPEMLVQAYRALVSKLYAKRDCPMKQSRNPVHGQSSR